MSAPRLPEAARARLLALADDELAAMSAAELPPSLRPFRAFTRTKRARAAAPALAAALEADDGFRAAVATRAREALPELAAAVDAGAPPAAADPVLVAALAYLLRPDGWRALVETSAAELASATDSEEVALLRAEVSGLREELAAARRSGADADRAQRAVTQELRRQLREAQQRARTAEEAQRKAEQRAAAAEGRVAAARADAGRQSTDVARTERRLRAQVAQLEADLEAARSSARSAAREGRAVDTMRLRVLLDTVVDAANGLRRELALPPSAGRPGDAVAGADEQIKAAGSSRGLVRADPAHLEALLGAPQVHLIVDGYNVTKTGYPALTLEDQRSRLVQGLGALVARTGAEVTVVFDGAEQTAPVAAPRARGVRVRFSPPGQIADELIAEYVRAEPPGRAVVVVSSDREVADHAAGRGAAPVPSAALVALLDRA